jgi:hypothetical protein
MEWPAKFCFKRFSVLRGHTSAASAFPTKTLPGSLGSVVQAQIQVFSTSPFFNIPPKVGGSGVVIWTEPSN